jgi:hypothetical protein
MPRIKIVGYVPADDYELDSDDPTGVSATAYDELSDLTVLDLEDLDVSVVAD